MVDGIVTGAVNCVGIDICTKKVFPTISAAKVRASSEYHSASRALD